MVKSGFKWSKDKMQNRCILMPHCQKMYKMKRRWQWHVFLKQFQHLSVKCWNIIIPSCNGLKHYFIYCIIWRKFKQRDSQQFHQYLQNEQPLLTSNLWLQKRTRTCSVGNLGPILGQSEKCGDVKPYIYIYIYNMCFSKKNCILPTIYPVVDLCDC
jgi:hypothetical protein